MSINELFKSKMAEAGDGTGAGASGGGADGSGSGGGGDSHGSVGAGAGNQGGAAADWRASIPAEYATEKVWEPYKDKALGEVLKAHVEQAKLIGRSIRIPGKDAGKADLDAFQGKLKEVPGVLFMPDGADEAAMGDLYTKLGRPESPDKYQIARPAKLPEGMFYDEAREKVIRDTAHKLGLSQKQLAGLFDVYNAGEIQKGEARMAEVKKGQTALRAEWGAGFDQRMAAANAFLKQFADADTAAELTASLITYPGLAKALSAAGMHFLEDGVISGDKGGLAPSVTELKEKIAEIQNNKDHPYHDRKKPGHAEAIARVDDMHRQISEITKAARA